MGAAFKVPSGNRVGQAGHRKAERLFRGAAQGQGGKARSRPLRALLGPRPSASLTGRIPRSCVSDLSGLALECVAVGRPDAGGASVDRRAAPRGMVTGPGDPVMLGLVDGNGPTAPGEDGRRTGTLPPARGPGRARGLPAGSRPWRRRAPPCSRNGTDPRSSRIRISGSASS